MGGRFKQSGGQICELILLLLVSANCAPAQKPVTPNVETAKQAPLVVKAVSPDEINLRVKEVPLPRVVKELEKQLRIPIRVSPLLQSFKASAETNEANLLTALLALAPRVHFDEIVSGGPGGQTYPITVYLDAAHEAAPKLSADYAASEQAISLAGDTDAEEASAPAEPLQVRVKDGLCTIRADRHPLHAVLHLLAEQLAIPLSMPAEPRGEISLDLRDAPLDVVLRALPESVQLYRRVTYPGGQSIPLQLVLQATDTQRP